MKFANSLTLCCAVALIIGCSQKTKTEPAAGNTVQPATSFFKVDSSTAGSVTGTVRYTGKKPSHKMIDMSEDPACVEAHHGKAYDESLTVGSNSSLAIASFSTNADPNGTTS